MKTFILFSGFFFVISIFVNSQVLKKFSGVYPLSAPWNQDGKAVYSYTEENLKQVLHGKFSLTYNGKDNQKGFSLVVSGSFKNGLRDGKWMFIATFTDWKTSEENLFKTGACTLTVNYKSGQPDGNCSYNCSQKFRQKTDQKGKSGYTAYTKVNKENIKLLYNQGIINSFLYEIPNDNKKDYFKMSFIFDEAGYIQSITREKENKKSVEKWHHGIDKPTDEDIIGLDRYLNYQKNYKDSVAYLPYSYNTVKFPENATLNPSVNSENITNLINKIYNYDFLWNDIPGDLCYDARKSKTNMLQNVSINGFLARVKITQSAKEKVLPVEKINQFNKINSLIKTINSALTDAKIEKCSGITGASVYFDMSRKYLDTLVTLQRTVNELEKLYKGTGTAKSYSVVVETGDFLKSVAEQEFLDYSVSKLVSINENIQPLIKELEIIYKKNEYDASMKEGNSFIEQKNYDAAKKAFQRAQFMNPDDPAPKLKTEEVKTLEALSDADTKRMKIFNYLVDNFRKIPANYKYGEERKNLYSAYLILKDFYLTNIDNPANDSFKKLEICNEAVKLVEKMNDLQNKNTEELEKQLKKIKDPVKIKEILGL